MKKQALGTTPSYRDMHMQANREAKATVIALVLTIIVWCALGFGLAGSSLQIFHTPIWIIGGTVGTWIFAVAVAVVMAKFIITDDDLDAVEPIELEHAAVESEADNG